MKPFSSFLFFFVAAVVAITACNKESTAPAADSEEPGIGFAFGGTKKNEFVLKGMTTSQELKDILTVRIAGASPAPANIHVGLSDKTAELVDAYNAANNSNLEKLPSGNYTFSPEIILYKDQLEATAGLILKNTAGLRTNKTYAVGIAIERADNPLPLAADRRTVLVTIRVTNSMYVGRYLMKGQFYHPSLEPTFAPHSTIIELRDTFHFPNRVSVYWPYSGGFNTPAFKNGGQAHCCFAAQHLALSIDPVTDKVRCVWDEWVGNEDTNYGQLPAYNGNTYTNRFDPETKTYYTAFGYTFGAGNTIIPASRVWIDTLIYLGPL